MRYRPIASPGAGASMSMRSLSGAGPGHEGRSSRALVLERTHRGHTTGCCSVGRLPYPQAGADGVDAPTWPGEREPRPRPPTPRRRVGMPRWFVTRSGTAVEVAPRASAAGREPPHAVPIRTRRASPTASARRGLRRGATCATAGARTIGIIDAGSLRHPCDLRASPDRRAWCAPTVMALTPNSQA
jgi:hypothetical protein